MSNNQLSVTKSHAVSELRLSMGTYPGIWQPVPMGTCVMTHSRLALQVGPIPELCPAPVQLPWCFSADVSCIALHHVMRSHCMHPHTHGPWGPVHVFLLTVQLASLYKTQFLVRSQISLVIEYHCCINSHTVWLSMLQLHSPYNLLQRHISWHTLCPLSKYWMWKQSWPVTCSLKPSPPELQTPVSKI